MKSSAFRWFVSFEKEEEWLNQMASKGLHMVSFSFPGIYRFEVGAPGEYVYRLELLENLVWTQPSREYLNFMADSGAEVVATHGRWVFFRKRASEGSFVIYSDNQSKQAHYKRLATMFGVVGLLNLANGISFWGRGLEIDSGPRMFFGGLMIVFSAILIPLTVKYLRTIRRLGQEGQVSE